MTPEEEIQQLSVTLSLAAEKQDWGIVNANAKRASEFISFALQARCSQVQEYALVELVFASINESMLDDLFSPALENLFMAFLRSELFGLTSQSSYWAKLSNRDEFPVAEYLQTRRQPP